MKRRVFYSFHYEPDNWRAAQVRNIKVIEGNRPATDNDWEKVTGRGHNAIKKWISDQMSGRTCTVVLVGSKTANRIWIKHEIKKSWEDKMGVVGIYIHGLKDANGKISLKGANPFDYIPLENSGKKLSSIVKCYNPSGHNSLERYDWISKHIAAAVEEAISIRRKN